MDEYRYIHADDLKCPCCGEYKYDEVFLDRVERFCWEIQDFLDLVNLRFIITSGARCNDHNKKVGGSTGSHHLFNSPGRIDANAIDGIFEGIDLLKAFSLVDEYGFEGRGFYPYKKIIHIDGGPRSARWFADQIGVYHYF
jgi:uncharacterized protein YcbK (DUF882 family)